MVCVTQSLVLWTIVCFWSLLHFAIGLSYDLLTSDYSFVIFKLYLPVGDQNNITREDTYFD